MAGLLSSRANLDRATQKETQMDRLRFPAVLVLVSILFPVANVLATQSTVWQIGAFDQSSHEFNHSAPLSSPDYHPVFIVGKSTAKDWPAAQPGSENPAEGLRPHPFTILFTLPSKPRGTYRLIISALLYEPRVPYLEISINDREGTFYFPRKLSYYPGDSDFESPIYSAGQVSLLLPDSALRRGENRLVLTALDHPEDGPGDSWLIYDALRLTHSTEASRFHPQMALQPTIYYVRKHGTLEEMMRVTVNLDRKVRRGTLRLRVAGRQYRAALASAPDFGEQRFEFFVPELPGPTPAQMSLRVNGLSVKQTVTLRPERKWKLFVVPHEHLDIGFTDYRGKVFEVHDRNLDTLIPRLLQHPTMRWSLDGNLIVQHYLATRTPAARQAFLSLARQGRIGVPAQYANLLTGYASLEELIRSTFYGYHLHKKYGVPFDYVNITDVPSYTWSYPSVLHALGIRYLAAASNNDRAPILLWGRWNTKSPFWWEGPDGSKVLMSYSRQYFQLSFICQLPAQMAACRQSLPTFLQAYDRPSYKPDAALIFGTQVENTAYVPGTHAFIKKWNATYAYPKMIESTFPDYFRYIDQHFGNELPTVFGDGGPYWEDGIASDARYAALDRIDQQRALSAEKLSTLGSYLEKDVAGERTQLRRMWQNLILYAEHTFTSWGGYSRPNSDETRRQSFGKDQFVVNAHQELRSILDQSLSQLAAQIHMPAPGMVVFNPVSWTRSGFVETDLNRQAQIEEYPNMTVVPYQILRRGNGYDHVRFLARDVPPMGYVCYRLAPRNADQAPAVEDVTLPLSNTIENRYYRVEFDPSSGAIRSIYDKQLGVELVNPRFCANQYLYVTGGEGTQIVYLNKTLPKAELTIHPSRKGRVTRIERTSYGTIMTYQTSGMDARRITSEVILFRQQKKIEFINHLDKLPETHKEAVYFAFPFAMTHPEFDYEIQNGWVNPARDILKGGSLEWFTVRHWVRVSGSRFAVGLVPIDTPLICLGDINRGTWPKAFRPKEATVYSYAMNNYWHTNYMRVQRGHYTFRYVLTSGRNLSPVMLSRLGLEAMTPLEHQQVISNDKVGNPPGALPPSPHSFLTVSSPDVEVEDWKAAMDGQGTILRLVEVGGESTTVQLTFPLFQLQNAWLTNAVEQNQAVLMVAKNSLEIPIKPHQIVTLRVVAKMPAAASAP